MRRWRCVRICSARHARGVPDDRLGRRRRQRVRQPPACRQFRRPHEETRVAFQRILEPGRNCWRLEPAERVAFLIDGEAYFAALHDALQRARSSAFLLTWDIYSRLCLVPAAHRSRTVRPLRDLLDGLTVRQSQLQIFMLNWDFSLLLGRGRKWLRSTGCCRGPDSRTAGRCGVPDRPFPLPACSRPPAAVQH